MKWWNKKIFFLLVSILLINGLFFSIVKAVSTDGSINVQVTVPGGSGSPTPPPPPPPPPPVDNPPSISGVASSTAFTTAQVNWTVADDKGIAAVSFVYGLTTAYGQSSNPSGSYSVNLTGLTTGTVYFFKITATDTGGNNVNYTGSFKTTVSSQVTIFPNISNITVKPGVNSAGLTFTTDKNTIAEVKYGLTTSLGSSATEGASYITNHDFTIAGLSPNKTFYYQIVATDSSLNSTSTSILSFKTLSDVTSPPDVSSLQILPGQNVFNLTWKNPSLSFTPDFIGVKILRKINSKATGPNDSSASVVYNGSNETLSNDTVLSGFTYYYTVFSYDTSGNFSPGVFVIGNISAINTEICNDSIDNNNDGKIDCADQTCINEQICKIPIASEICNNNIDDNNDGKIDCADQTCASNDNCKKLESQISGPSAPSVPSAASGVLSACKDNKDNDSDNLVDYPADSGCVSLDDNDEYNPPAATVPEFEKISLDKLKFYAGSRQIELLPKQGVLSGLSGSNLSVIIKKNNLIGLPKNLILRVGDSGQHQFIFDGNNTYNADVLFPTSGQNQAFVEIDYGSNQLDSISVTLQAVDFGSVVDNRGQKLAGAEIVLHKENGEVFPASIYGQQNPQLTGSAGLMGWMVPNGRFYLTAKKDKFYEYVGSIFEVKNNIINANLNLVAVPPKIKDVIDPTASVVKNVANVAKNLAQKTTAATAIATKQVQKAAAVVQEISADPVVQQVATQVVAPTAVGVAAVGTVALVSWVDILPLLRFLFLQPLLLLGRGKRTKWGIVYNSLSKLPVDLALVRLFNMDTGKLLQTKVTSSDGRYFFVVDAGRYRLEVRKGNFVFPTSLLKGFQIDGQRLDIYHGEEIKVTDKGSVITANIPLDPAGEKLKTPKRLIFSKLMHRVQGAVSWIGLLVTVVSLYIAPTWYMWVLLGVHLAMTLVFRRLAKPPASKGWGIVYDENTKKPLSQVVARLFDSKFNKLVATEVTGQDGKYYFMAGDNQYYVSYERQGYEPLKTEIIDLQGKTAETIAKDVNLKKK